MKALMQAIDSRFRATNGVPSGPSAFYTAVGGKLYLAKVPQNTALPYAVMDLVTDTPADTFTESLENCTVQIAAFLAADKSASTAMDALEAIKALYDNCTLTLTGYACIYMQRENAFADTTDGIWRVVAEYRILLEKS